MTASKNIPHTLNNTLNASSPNAQLPEKTPLERFLHALVFEIIALVICSPVLAWVFNTSLLESAALTLMISLCAMLINMIYNLLFDKLEAKFKFQRTPIIRGLHAVGFEGSLIAVVIPLAAWWLNISLIEAFYMEAGLLLFFLPYTYIYNLSYDKLRVWYFTTRQAK